MRAIAFFLLIGLITLSATGQVGPVFSYTNPPKFELKALAESSTLKGIAFGNYLLKTAREGYPGEKISLDFIFNNLELLEVNLVSYQNSGFDEKSNSMVSTKGTKQLDFTWCLIIGNYALPLIKQDCGNILKASAFKICTTKVEATPLEKKVAIERDPNPSIFSQPVVVEKEFLGEIPKTEPPRTWWQKNKGWVIPTAVLLVGGGTYLAIKGAPSAPSGGSTGDPLP